MAPVARPTCLALRDRTRPAAREYGATFHSREHRVLCPSGPYVALTPTVMNSLLKIYSSSPSHREHISTNISTIDASTRSKLVK